MSEASAVQNTELAPATPMQMIQVAFQKAIEQGGALEVVDRILEQQKWMIQHDEEERFNDTLKRIQRQLKKIPKRGYNKETKSHYALVEDVDDEIQKLLDAEGMTLSFVPGTSTNPDNVLIIGTLSLGAYTKHYPLDMPSDGKGAKGGGVMSRTHATGSAITYGRRYLKDLIFDLRYSKVDDDGNAANGIPDNVKIAVNALMDCEDLEALQAKFKQLYREALAANDSVAVKAFMDANTKRKGQLSGPAQD